MSRLARSWLGPLAPLAAFFAVGMVLFSLSRVALVAANWNRLRDVPGALWLFPIGCRMDSSLLSIVLFPPAVLLVAFPRPDARWFRALIGVWLAGMAAAIVFTEAATWPFLAQYDGRPNRIFVDYLVYPHEVLGMLWADYRALLALGAVLIAGTSTLVWRWASAALRAPQVWSYGQRLLRLPLIAGLLLLGMRSSLGHRPANISTAAFSSDHLANELALDSAYSVGYAIYSERNEVGGRKLFGALPPTEALARVRRQMRIAPDGFTNPTIPLLHAQPSQTPRARPYNLVVILEESLGAEFVGTLGGLPLTPEFDALATRGVLLTNLYATGTRTVRGIEATVAGFLPTAGTSVVKLGLAQHGFFTAADLLRRAGYRTEFLYGGMSNFDNMASFFLGNGFDRVIDEPSFPDPVLAGTWGVSDEDLFRHADEVFAAHGSEPFFAVILSTSNHPPYEYPAGRIAASGPPNTPHNAIRYADYAIGDFFRRAARQEYFERTVFLVVADHDARVYGADLVPIERFHIPGLIIAPGLAPARLDRLASQVDLMPTLFDAIGLDTVHPMIGHDLLAADPGAPGHAFMQYDETNAYRVGDQVVIHQPKQPARQFRYTDGRLVPTALDPELARDALAHLQVPEEQYRERSYRLPNATQVVQANRDAPRPHAD